jgi:hypothetical protein
MNLSGVKATGVWIDEMGFEPADRRIATSIRDTTLFIDKTPYYYANPIMYSFIELEEMAQWCWDTFGPCGYHYHQESMQVVWNYRLDPDYLFWFKEEKHLTMFILRWS